MIDKAGFILEHDETRIDAVAMPHQRELADEVLAAAKSSYRKLKVDVRKILEKHRYGAEP